MTTTTPGTCNGFDVQALHDTVAALSEQPAAGKVTNRGRTTWDSGMASDPRTVEIERNGQVTTRSFTLRSDLPEDLLGTDTGPSPGEILLAALGACISATYASHATARGIVLDELEVHVEGDLDLNGFLQLSQTRAGFAGIRTELRVRSDADDAALDELGEVITTASPIHDTIANPVPISGAFRRIH